MFESYDYSPEVDGAFVRKLREDSGLQLFDFATMYGVTAQTIQNWENNKFVPSKLHKINLLQLRNKIDRAKKEEVKNVLAKLLLTGGAIAVMYWLFNNND